MHAVIKKWGNSAAVRVPTSVMSELGLGVDDPIDIRVEDGRIVIEPAAPTAPRLEDLLEGLTADNLHDEADFGLALGREAL
ncbi:AbrB/MazE/SpoVT family DNA-binding domain-containing protein [Rubrimonas sp.]|uniref:AbrB/MazE/SpoVT family DNA-binding domain-containing protein n=1 Tax=Rubrimonas sp. TaxID=2036015 RepID=UPI002FDEBE37